MIGNLSIKSFHLEWTNEWLTDLIDHLDIELLPGQQSFIILG